MNTPKTYTRHARIVIDDISIPLIEENSNKTSTSKNNLSKSTESKPGLAQVVVNGWCTITIANFKQLTGNTQNK